MMRRNVVSVTGTLSYNGLGQLAMRQEERKTGGWEAEESRVYAWDREDRLVSVVRYEGAGVSEVLAGTLEYTYCPSCQGAMSQRIEKNASGVVLSWLRYEYEGLKLLRIDEVYDNRPPTALSNPPKADVSKGGRGTPWRSIRSPRSAIRPTQAHGVEDPADGDDRWRPLNVYVHGPGSISDIVRAHWYAYDDTGDSWCYEGNYYYTYDALGNVLGVFRYGEFSRWEMDAFGNDLPGGNDFLPMDQEGPKEHLTGKMFDEQTGLYYFHARWYDPEVGRFVGRELPHPDVRMRHTSSCGAHKSRLHDQLQARTPYHFCRNNPVSFVDPNGEREFPGDREALCSDAYDKLKKAYGEDFIDDHAGWCAPKCRTNCALTTPNVKIGAFLSQCLAACREGKHCADAMLDYYKCVYKIKKPKFIKLFRCFCKLKRECRKYMGF